MESSAKRPPNSLIQGKIQANCAISYSLSLPLSGFAPRIRRLQRLPKHSYKNNREKQGIHSDIEEIEHPS